jgi:hypothetical protein
MWRHVDRAGTKGGAAGAVLGVDISAPMLEIAPTPVACLQLLHLEFREADATTAKLPARNDLHYSRFGVMFFGQPGKALVHLRQSLHPASRLVLCAGAPREKPWTMAPLAAVCKVVNATPSLPTTPCLDRLRLPAKTGCAAFLRTPVSRIFNCNASTRRFPWAPRRATPRDASEGAVRCGQTSRFVDEVGKQNLTAILAAIEEAPDRVAVSHSRWRGLRIVAVLAGIAGASPAPFNGPSWCRVPPALRAPSPSSPGRP